MESNTHLCSQYTPTGLDKINNHEIFFTFVCVCVCVYTHFMYLSASKIVIGKWVTKILRVPVPSMKSLTCFKEIRSVMMYI